MKSLARSENSAFTPYKRKSSQNTDSSALFTINRACPPLIQPQPRLAVPLALPQEERSDSSIYKKIRGKRKERSSSVGELRQLSPEQEIVRNSVRTSLTPTRRSHDFKKILQKFQTADRSAQVQRGFTVDIKHRIPPSNEISSVLPPKNVWSSVRIESAPDEVKSLICTKSPSKEILFAVSMDSASNSPRDNPLTTSPSAFSRLSMCSMHSPISFLPTRDTSILCTSSPSFIPPLIRTIYSPEIDVNGVSRSHTPLSHTSSSPELVPQSTLTINVPSSKRRSLPERWVKETDIDNSLSLPMSPFGSSSTGEFSSDDVIHSTQSAPISKIVSVERFPLNPTPATQNRYGGSCRRVLTSLQGTNGNTNGVHALQNRFKDKKNIAEINACKTKSEGSRSNHSIPVFMSNENMLSRSSSNIDKNHVYEEVYKQYQQISLCHVYTLSIVADRLSNELRRGEEPVSRNRLGQIDFSSFIISSAIPILIKGKSLFYNAILPRPGLPDYPVTLMIAPCSQYAPIMRRGDSHLFSLPSFLEIEDHDGTIDRFLHKTGARSLNGRNTKVIALPRLNLCSFHSLAAHHLDERNENNYYEELVSFILLQLLSALKMLQSDGIETLSTNFKEFLLAYRFPPVTDSQSKMKEIPQLIFLPETLGAEIESGADELVGLCKYALRALCTLLHHKMNGQAPSIKLRSSFSRALRACAVLLQEDKSSSLTRAKNVLELALWWDGEPFKNEADVRLWIDVARAEGVDNMLRQLVCEPGCRLGPREQFKVEFLLGATPRSILDSQTAILNAQLF